MRTQHLRDLELKQVHAQTEGNPLEQNTSQLPISEDTVPQESDDTAGLEPYDLQDNNDDLATFDSLEEW